MSTANLVGYDHPAFGYNQAWYLFALTNERGMARILLVEAPNPWAIQTMERVVAKDGRVSPNCELLSMHLYPIGVRSNRVNHVGYVDFMLDMVEQNRILADALVAHSFHMSLSDQDKAYANIKLDAIAKMQEAIADKKLSDELDAVRYSRVPFLPEADVIDVPAEVVEPAESPIYQKVMAALLDLGFKKPQAKKILDDMGSRVYHESAENLIKSALQQLHAA